MTEKENPIEEMAKVIADCIAKLTLEQGYCGTLDMAKALLDTNHRKIPEGAVVLKKEEYEELNKHQEKEIQYLDALERLSTEKYELWEDE